MKRISIRSMSHDEFNEYKPQSLERYKIDKMRANSLTAEEAQKIAEDDFNRVLPNELQSKDNFLYTLLGEDETKVGVVWYCVRGAQNNRKAFIADIFIDEKERGHGYGKAAMLAVESQAREQGLRGIGLHVFGFNERAIGLYKSLGYETTDLVMEKELKPQRGM